MLARGLTADHAHFARSAVLRLNAVLRHDCPGAAWQMAFSVAYSNERRRQAAKCSGVAMCVTNVVVDAAVVVCTRHRGR